MAYKKEGATQEQTNSIEEEIRTFFEPRTSVLQNLAGYQILIEPGNSTAFFPDQIKIEVGEDLWKQAKEAGLSDWQKYFVGAHEVEHFRDFLEDPNGFMQSFNGLAGRAQELEERALQTLREIGLSEDQISYWSSPGTNFEINGQSTTLSRISAHIYDQLHLFYNSVDDIHDNKNVGRKIKIFAKEGHRYQEVKALYRDFAFPTDPRALGKPPEENQPVNYTDLSRVQQLSYSLLRKTMVPDQEITVAEEISTLLNSRIVENTSLEAIIDDITNPTTKYDEIQHTAGWRWKEISSNVLPIIENLILDDIKDLPPPPNDNDRGEENQGNNKTSSDTDSESGNDNNSKGDDQNKTDDKNDSNNRGNPNPFSIPAPKIDSNSLKQYLDSKKSDPEEIHSDTQDNTNESDENKVEPMEDQNKSDDDKKSAAQTANAQQDKEFAKKHDLPLSDVEEYRRIREEIRPWIEEHAALVELVITKVKEQLTQGLSGYFPNGEFDTNEFIRRYGMFLADNDLLAFFPDKLETHKQEDWLRDFTIRPKKFTEFLVLDGSGSMTPDRREMLKKLCVFKFESMAFLETTLNLRFRLDDPFTSQLRIWMFGSNGRAREISNIEIGPSHSYESGRAELLKGFPDMLIDYGSTCDADPLRKIIDVIEKAKYGTDQEKRDDEKIFLTEITDGGVNGSTSPNRDPESDSKDAIRRLVELGVATKALQTGTINQEEKAVFARIWGADGQYIRDIAMIIEATKKLYRDWITEGEILKISYS